MELIALIDQLDEVINAGTWVPGTGRFLIDKEKLSSLAEQIRDAVPVDLSEAQELLQMRERLINQALLEASRVKSAADEDARIRVAESELTRDAQNQADAVVADAQSRASKMLAEAEAQARSRIDGADTYVQETLQQLEETLSQTLSTVQRGLQSLHAPGERTSV